jgi:hypothetical protein
MVSWWADFRIQVGDDTLFRNVGSHTDYKGFIPEYGTIHTTSNPGKARSA